MLPDRVSNPGPLTYESGALPIALHGPANSLSGFGLSAITKQTCPNSKSSGKQDLFTYKIAPLTAPCPLAHYIKNSDIKL